MSGLISIPCRARLAGREATPGQWAGCSHESPLQGGPSWSLALPPQVLDPAGAPQKGSWAARFLQSAPLITPSPIKPQWASQLEPRVACTLPGDSRPPICPCSPQDSTWLVSGAGRRLLWAFQAPWLDTGPGGLPCELAPPLLQCARQTGPGLSPTRSRPAPGPSSPGSRHPPDPSPPQVSVGSQGHQKLEEGALRDPNLYPGSTSSPGALAKPVSPSPPARLGSHCPLLPVSHPAQRMPPGTDQAEMGHQGSDRPQPPPAPESCPLLSFWEATEGRSLAGMPHSGPGRGPHSAAPGVQA